MDGFLKGPARDGSVKSISLEELLAERPSLFRKIWDFAKAGLMVCGALSLAIAAGIAPYYLRDGGGEPLLVSETLPTPPRANALTEIPDATTIAHAGRFAPPVAAEPTPIVEARLPRPRPDEPVFTGSIGEMDIYYPGRARERFVDPCEALRRLSGPLQIRVRCGEESRYYAPPPPPRPYHPPRY